MKLAINNTLNHAFTNYWHKLISNQWNKEKYYLGIETRIIIFELIRENI